MISIFINDRQIYANEGDTILKVARSNKIFIPAICYLENCSATLACRLCMVEADGKIVYSCNAKAKDGMKIYTNTKDILSYRKAIMQTYCINHPLECGVCDKSGECELQNYVHMTGVNSQEYFIADTHKTVQDWGLVKYDPSLCIVCERCVTVCKDKIGDSNLKTTARGGDSIDKNFKETMPKDAYAVWNKFQKNLITRVNDQCCDCGECVAVCPVGALGFKHFEYKSNSWELAKIAASNPHSCDCELIFYEVKHTSIENNSKKIYRVTSDFTFAPLNGAARFAFDFHKENATKNSIVFERIVNSIKNKTIGAIKFNSFITNEEAKILNLIKEKFNIKLINQEAFKFQQFLKYFQDSSGSNLFNANTQDVIKSDLIIIAGSLLRYDCPNLSYKLNNAIKINKSTAYYFHTNKDLGINFGKNLKSIVHDYHYDIEILLLILQNFGRNLPNKLSQILEDANKDIEIEINSEKVYKKISSYAKIFELEDEDFSKFNDKSKILVIGEDFIFSNNSKTLAVLLGMIQKFTDIRILIIPPRTNSLGVSLICDLDDENILSDEKIFGYNETGDLTFSVYGGDLDAPALNLQEGTFTNYDKRVVPTNSALTYLGYELNDIANALKIEQEYTINYTPKLGKYFKDIKFDDLQNYYDNDGSNKRGYELDLFSMDTPFNYDEIDIKNYNDKFDDGDIVVYKANPIEQFSKFSAHSTILNDMAHLYCGDEFLKKYQLNDKDKVVINPKSDNIIITVKKDNSFQGAYLPYFDDKLDIDKIFNTRYAKIEIQKVDNE